MINRLLENQSLIRTTCIFLFIVIGVILYSITSMPIMLIYMVPFFIVMALFCEWLRGLEEAKNIKHFMILRGIVFSIGVIFLIKHFLDLSRDDMNTNPWYLFCWFIVIFIGDIIEKKYFVKKAPSQQENT